MSRANKNWIQKGKDKGTIRAGGLHRSLGIPEGKKIPASKIEKAEHSRNPKIRSQANLAETFSHIRKG